jgi:hypothetical protein
MKRIPLRLLQATSSILLACLLLSGCATRPQKGGTASTKMAGFAATLAQPENPQASSSQTVERTVVVEPAPAVVPPGTPDKPAPAPARVTETTKTTTTIGPAQKDTARELAAKLKATAPAFWVGIACILAAGALFYFGWHSPAVIAAATGAGLMLFSHLVATAGTLMLVVAVAGLAIVLVFRAYEKGALDSILPDRFDKFPTKSV